MQSYGEVSRSFVVRWKDDLDDTWHLLDKDGNIHPVKYNKNLQSPTIVSGWTQLRDFYGSTGNHKLTMTYYGLLVFLLTVFKRNSQPQTFPKWHSLYKQNPNLVAFKVLLNQYKVMCNNLVSDSRRFEIQKQSWIENCISNISHINLILISGRAKFYVSIHEK